MCEQTVQLCLSSEVLGSFAIFCSPGRAYTPCRAVFYILVVSIQSVPIIRIRGGRNHGLSYIYILVRPPLVEYL